MIKRKAYYKGLVAGTTAAELAEDTKNPVSLAFQLEEHARQYSPFEQLASEINKQDNAEELWDEYDRGVQDGISQIINDNQNEE